MFNLNYSRAFQGEEGKPILNIIRGLPGAGKSTYAKKYAIYHLEADMWFSRDGTYDFNAEFLGRAHRWCLDTAKVLLNQGRTVDVANTSTTFDEVKEYVKFCKKNGIHIDVTTLTSEFTSIHDVPIETMARMTIRFQPHDEFVKKINDYQCS